MLRTSEVRWAKGTISIGISMDVSLTLLQLRSQEAVLVCDKQAERILGCAMSREMKETKVVVTIKIIKYVTNIP
jgi:hypothetical protein